LHDALTCDCLADHKIELWPQHCAGAASNPCLSTQRTHPLSNLESDNEFLATRFIYAIDRRINLQELLPHNSDRQWYLIPPTVHQLGQSRHYTVSARDRCDRPTTHHVLRYTVRHFDLLSGYDRGIQLRLVRMMGIEDLLLPESGSDAIKDDVNTFSIRTRPSDVID
jgi:hypothetical protein